MLEGGDQKISGNERKTEFRSIWNLISYPSLSFDLNAYQQFSKIQKDFLYSQELQRTLDFLAKLKTLSDRQQLNDTISGNEHSAVVNIPPLLKLLIESENLNKVSPTVALFSASDYLNVRLPINFPLVNEPSFLLNFLGSVKLQSLPASLEKASLLMAVLNAQQYSDSNPLSKNPPLFLGAYLLALQSMKEEKKELIADQHEDKKEESAMLASSEQKIEAAVFITGSGEKSDNFPPLPASPNSTWSICGVFARDANNAWRSDVKDYSGKKTSNLSECVLRIYSSEKNNASHSTPSFFSGMLENDMKDNGAHHTDVTSPPHTSITTCFGGILYDDNGSSKKFTIEDSDINPLPPILIKTKDSEFRYFKKESSKFSSKGYVRFRIINLHEQGYEIFGITRKAAHALLIEKKEMVKDILDPAIFELLKQTVFKDFLMKNDYVYIREYREFGKFEEFSDNLYLGFFAFNFTESKNNQTKPNLAVFNALARIRNISFSIWRLEEKMQGIVLHDESERMVDLSLNNLERIDVLILKDGQFERLEFVGYENQILSELTIYPLEINEDNKFRLIRWSVFHDRVALFQYLIEERVKFLAQTKEEEKLVTRMARDHIKLWLQIFSVFDNKKEWAFASVEEKRILEEVLERSDPLQILFLNRIFCLSLEFQALQPLSIILASKDVFHSKFLEIYRKSVEDQSQRHFIISVLILGLTSNASQKEEIFLLFVKKCRQLSPLDFEMITFLQLKNIGMTSIKKLLPYLENKLFPNLRELDLRHNGLTKLQVKFLLKMFKHTNLRRVNLSENCIESNDETDWRWEFDEFAHQVKRDSFPLLEVIDVSCNGIHNHNEKLGGICERLVHHDALYMLLVITGFSLEDFLNSEWVKINSNESGNYTFILRRIEGEFKFTLNYDQYVLLRRVQEKIKVTDVSKVFDYLKRGIQATLLSPRSSYSNNTTVRNLEETPRAKLLDTLFDNHDEAPLSSLLRRHSIFCSTPPSMCESLLFKAPLNVEQGYVYLLAFKEAEHAALVFECITPIGQRVFQMAHLTVELSKIVIQYDAKSSLVGSPSYYLEKCTIAQFKATYNQCKSLWEEIDEETIHGLKNSEFSKYGSWIYGSSNKDEIVMQNCLKWAVGKIQKHLDINIEQYISLGNWPSRTVSNLLKEDEYKPEIPQNYSCMPSPEILIERSCLQVNPEISSLREEKRSKNMTISPDYDQHGLFSRQAEGSANNNNSRSSLHISETHCVKESKLKSLQMLLEATSLIPDTQNLKILFSAEQYSKAKHITQKLFKIGMASLEDNKNPRDVIWDKQQEKFYISLTSDEYNLIHQDASSFLLLQEKFSRNETEVLLVK